LEEEIAELDKVIGKLDLEISNARNQMRIADSDAQKDSILREYRR
jgi:hypothetical protein